MPTRNVVVTDHQSKLIDDLVNSGRYQNASEVLREGLRLVEAREAVEAAKLQALKAAARSGIAAIERGEYRDFDSASDLAAHLDRVAARVIAAKKPR